MGLDIFGKKTNGHLSGSYSSLHHNTRYLALLFCGMPKYLDNENKHSSFVYYMSKYSEDKVFSTRLMNSFFYSIQLSGHLFPNIMLHSDCEGTYTKNGKLDLDGNLMTGNSIKLMNELETLVSEPEFQTEEYSRHMEYTKAFYELVKDEINNGCGTIVFR